MDYNNLSTEELEKNFNPRESVENFSHYLEDSLLKSKDVKKQTHIYENIAYGKGPLQKLDIFGKANNFDSEFNTETQISIIFNFLCGG